MKLNNSDIAYLDAKECIQSEYTSFLFIEGKHLYDLINNVLSFMNPSNDEYEDNMFTNTLTLSVNDFVLSAIGTDNHRLIEYNHELMYRFSPNDALGILYKDALELKKILNNYKDDTIVDVMYTNTNIIFNIDKIAVYSFKRVNSNLYNFLFQSNYKYIIDINSEEIKKYIFSNKGYNIVNIKIKKQTLSVTLGKSNKNNPEWIDNVLNINIDSNYDDPLDIILEYRYLKSVLSKISGCFVIATNGMNKSVLLRNKGHRYLIMPKINIQ